MVQPHDETFDRRIRDAWEGYKIACIDVDVADYDETESIAWDLLQHELREIASERARTHAAGTLMDRAA